MSDVITDGAVANGDAPDSGTVDRPPNISDGASAATLRQRPLAVVPVAGAPSQARSNRDARPDFVVALALRVARCRTIRG
jgi:hypothetical protein